MTATELYQAEKAKRLGLRPTLAPLPVHTNPHKLACPECGSDRVVLGCRRNMGHQRRYGTARPKESKAATCADCAYRWRTRSALAFGNVRVVELRG